MFRTNSLHIKVFNFPQSKRKCKKELEKGSVPNSHPTLRNGEQPWWRGGGPGPLVPRDLWWPATSCRVKTEFQGCGKTSEVYCQDCDGAGSDHERCIQDPKQNPHHWGRTSGKASTHYKELTTEREKARKPAGGSTTWKWLARSTFWCQRIRRTHGRGAEACG